MPKSAILMCPSLSSNTLSSFKSLQYWTRQMKLPSLGDATCLIQYCQSTIYYWAMMAQWLTCFCPGRETYPGNITVKEQRKKKIFWCAECTFLKQVSVTCQKQCCSAMFQVEIWENSQEKPKCVKMQWKHAKCRKQGAELKQMPPPKHGKTEMLDSIVTRKSKFCSDKGGGGDCESWRRKAERETDTESQNLGIHFPLTVGLHRKHDRGTERQLERQRVVDRTMLWNRERQYTKAQPCTGSGKGLEGGIKELGQRPKRKRYL